MPASGGCSGWAAKATTSPGTSYTLLTDSPGARVKESRAVMALAFGVSGWSMCETAAITGAGLPAPLPADSLMVRYEDSSSCASSDWTGSMSIGGCSMPGASSAAYADRNQLIPANVEATYGSQPARPS